MHFGPVPTGDTAFEWTATDKHKAFKRVEGVTPLGFYREYVSAKADTMVSIINDPRNPYYKYVFKVMAQRSYILTVFRNAGSPLWRGGWWGKTKCSVELVALQVSPRRK